MYIGQIVHYRHEDICKYIRMGSRPAELLVQYVELLLCLFLMAEYLYDLLTVDHFLNVAVDAAESLLLCYEALAAARADKSYNPDDYEQHRQHYYGEPPAVNKHCGEYSHYGYCRAYELGDTVAEHFADSVGIVGVKAHELAVGVLVEKAYGKHFHLVEEIVPYAHKGCGGYLHHHALIEQGGKSAHGVYYYHDRQYADEPAVLPVACFKRVFQIVYYGLQNIVSRYARTGADSNADNSKEELQPEAVHITEYPLQSCEGMLGLRHCSLCSRRHYSSAPFCCESYTSR